MVESFLVARCARVELNHNGAIDSKESILIYYYGISQPSVSQSYLWYLLPMVYPNYIPLIIYLLLKKNPHFPSPCIRGTVLTEIDTAENKYRNEVAIDLFTPLSLFFLITFSSLVCRDGVVGSYPGVERQGNEWRTDIFSGRSPPFPFFFSQV